MVDGASDDGIALTANDILDLGNGVTNLQIIGDGDGAGAGADDVVHLLGNNATDWAFFGVNGSFNVYQNDLGDQVEIGNNLEVILNSSF
jgi:hypothetical protein